jgi:hypothetical protein
MCLQALRRLVPAWSRSVIVFVLSFSILVQSSLRAAFLAANSRQVGFLRFLLWYSSALRGARRDAMLVNGSKVAVFLFQAFGA